MNAACLNMSQLLPCARQVPGYTAQPACTALSACRPSYQHAPSLTRSVVRAAALQDAPSPTPPAEPLATASASDDGAADADAAPTVRVAKGAAAVEEVYVNPTQAADSAPLVDTSSDSEGEEASSSDIAVALARIAWETKGEDLMVLDVTDQVSWCRFMVFVTVFSRPQLNAIIAKMEKEVRTVYGRDIMPSGGRSAWEMLDAGDVVVHVFGADMRDHYDLESFYGASPEVELPFLRQENGAPGAEIEWGTTI